MGEHIAFLTIPASGHINPTLPLVAELVRRGHRVSYATGPAFKETVEAAGAEAVVLDWIPKPLTVSREGQTTEDLSTMLVFFVESMRRVLPAVETWLTNDRPAVLCYDMMTFLGPMMAERLGLREATTVPNFAGNEHFNLRDAVVPANFDPTHPKFQEFLAKRAAFARDFDVPVDKVAPTGTAAPLNLVFIPRAFQIAGETFDSSFHFVGPSIGARPETSDWEPPADGAPVLFVSLGTAVNDRPDFFANCAKAFAGSEWHVAMAIGEQVRIEDLGEIPANFDVRTYFPQPVVLQHAKAFLSHAGMNSVMEALLNQVPLATFPQTAEQQANAGRVAELGLGRTIADLSPESLRSTIDAVAADSGIRGNLAAMASHVRDAGGPTAAADAVEDYLAATE